MMGEESLETAETSIKSCVCNHFLIYETTTLGFFFLTGGGKVQREVYQPAAGGKRHWKGSVTYAACCVMHRHT